MNCFGADTNANAVLPLWTKQTKVWNKCFKRTMCENAPRHGRFLLIIKLKCGSQFGVWVTNRNSTVGSHLVWIMFTQYINHSRKCFDRTETTSSWGSWCGCFGLHPSAISVFWPAQTNRTKGENVFKANSTRINHVGTTTLVKLVHRQPVWLSVLMDRFDILVLVRVCLQL